MSRVDIEPRGIIGPTPEDLVWLADHKHGETRLSRFLRHPIVKGAAGVLGIVSIAELAAACTQPQPPAIVREATTTPTETPRPTPTLTPEPTPTPEPKVERNPLPEYGVFTGDVFTVDEQSGTKTQTGKIVIASIPRSETEIAQNNPEKVFFYYISNTRQLMPLQPPITKIEGDRVVATRGKWVLDITLTQPAIGKNVQPVLRGEIQGEMPGGKIEATQVGTCKETLERATRSMKNKQLKLGIDEERRPQDLDHVNISELAERGIIFPNSCPVPRLSSFNPLT